MSFRGYASIQEAPSVVTASLTQSMRARLKPPTPLYEGQDFSDVTPLLVENREIPSLTYSVSELKDAFLLIESGSDCVLFNAEGKAIVESATFANPSYKRFGPDELAAQAVPLDEDVVVGADPGWWTFYHWVVISLARMSIVASTFDDGSTVVVPEYRHDGSMRFSQTVWRETLACAGLWSRVRRLPDGVYRVRTAKLVWLSGSQQAYVSYLDAFRASMVAMRARADVADERPAADVVLLRDSDQRLSAAAFEALTALAERDGFEVVRPERLSFAEQARAFARARLVVAPHGAGLTNIIMSRPGLRLVEINTEYDGPYLRPWYYILAGVMGHDYAYLNLTRTDFDAQAIRGFVLGVGRGGA